MLCTASSYSFLPFVLTELFYRESRILYWLHLTFYFRDSLHATSRSYTKRQCVKVQIYRFMTYRVLCHVTLMLPVGIFLPTETLVLASLGISNVFFIATARIRFKLKETKWMLIFCPASTYSWLPFVLKLRIFAANSDNIKS